MASQEAYSEGLTPRDAATVVPPESPPFRTGRFNPFKVTVMQTRKVGAKAGNVPSRLGPEGPDPNVPNRWTAS